MSLLLLILGIVLIIGLIVFHEFGHFIAAKRNGVKVEAFPDLRMVPVDFSISADRNKFNIINSACTFEQCIN